MKAYTTYLSDGIVVNGEPIDLYVIVDQFSVNSILEII